MASASSYWRSSASPRWPLAGAIACLSHVLRGSGKASFFFPRPPPIRHVFWPGQPWSFPVRKWPGSFREPRRRGLGGARADEAGQQGKPEQFCAGWGGHGVQQ